MKRMKQFTSRMLAVMLAGTLAVGSLSVSAFGAEEAGSTVPAAEEFSLEEATENSAAEATATEEADGEVITESSSAEVVDGEGVTESPDAAFADTTQIAAEEEAVTSYTVTLDANGGYFTNEWDDSIGDYVEQAEAVVKQIPVGGTVTAVPVFTDPDGQGMSFAGWSLDANGDFLPQEQEGYAPVGDCVLYAVWKVEEAAIEEDTFEEVSDENDGPAETVQNTEIVGVEPGDIVDTEVEGEESVETEEGASLEDETPAEEDIDNEEASPEEEIEEAEESVETEEEASLEDKTPAEEGSETTQEECEQQIDENTAVVEEEKSALIDAADEQEESVSTDAARNVVESGTCGDNLTWTLTGTDSDLTLTISGSGEMKNFDKSSIPWETKKDKIKTIVVEDGITRVGNYAFYSLNNTTSVSLGGKVSSIGFHAFSNCVSLKSVTIPGSMIFISDYAFEDCTSLASITIPDGVISIGDHTFEGCTSLASITIPDGVTSIGYNTFADCSSLISITIPDGVKEINDCAFENCRSLKNVTIPDSVMSIGDGVFAGCSSLTSVRIPDSVTSIGFGVFSACSSLTSVRIPDSVTSIEELVFYGCSSLTSVRIPDSVTYIEYAAFKNCSSLASITFPDGVTSIGSEAFRDCSRLASITIPNSMIDIGVNSFKHCFNLQNIYYGGTKAEWDAIDGSDFYLDIDNLVLHTSDGVFGSVRAEKIALNKTSATLVKGASLQLKATVTPEDAADGTVTWKSSNTKVATVTSTGKVKAVSAGTTTITAMTGEGKLKVSCTIKVVNPYTINFNKNATKATLKTSSKKVNPGSAIGELPTPNYSGYYFNGWYTEKKDGTKVTAKTKPSKSMTLYAHWVKRRSLKKAKITVGSCTYNTKAQKPKVTVKYGSKTLKEGSNYTLTYTNNKNASKKAAVIVKGKNAYKDSVKKTFAINQRDISKSPVSITLKKNKFGFTGKTIKPGYTVAITVGGKAVNLANGTDFTVAYKNNVKIGTASIVFKGKGNYKGAKTLKFYILKKATVTLNLNKGSNSRVTPVLPKGSKNTVGILAGEKIGKIPTPTRKGYTFVGWFTTPKATGGTQIKPEKTRFDAGETKNQTIYARWKKNVYKITFKYDGNGLGLSCPFATPKERTYTVEDTVTLPILTSKYAKFNGWKTTPNAVTSDKLIKKIGEKATSGDRVLYLDYRNYEYSIVFSGSEGGSVSNGTKHCITCSSKDTLPKAVFTPPTGKAFDKWYCTENGQYYQDGAEFERLTTEDGKVFHFVAVWKLKYDINGTVDYAVSKAADLYSSGILCAGFVSRCIINGGRFPGFAIKETVGDLADELTRNGFVQYNIVNNGTSIYTKDSESNGKISVGDVIIYYCTSEDHPKNGAEYYHWMHAALVTYIDPKNGQVYVTDTNKGGKAWVNDKLAAQYNDGIHGYQSTKLIYYLYHFEK